MASGHSLMPALILAPALGWTFFHLFVAGVVGLDLYLARHYEGRQGIRFAAVASVCWVLLALLFAAGIAYVRGRHAATSFVTAYLLEKALSVDNLFVFLALFRTFAIPPACQRRILLWGIIGAVVMRAGFIIAGLELVARFTWVLDVFALVLLWMAYRLFKEDADVKEKSLLVMLTRWIPLAPGVEECHFFVKYNGRWCATSACIALLAIEASDVLFALDSIPAVLGITQDFFIAYTSNIFAILGLRALYFALSALLVLFHYLNQGLAFLLVFIAGKLLLHGWIEIPDVFSLLLVCTVMGASIIFSLLYPKERPLHKP